MKYCPTCEGAIWPSDIEKEGMCPVCESGLTEVPMMFSLIDIDNK